jgi:hypothetical protein
MGHNLLPKDLLGGDEVTLLDKVDTWLTEGAWSDIYMISLWPGHTYLFGFPASALDVGR